MRRWLLTALALLWCGTANAFNPAHVDTFQNGVKPDANFAGISDATIRHTLTSGLADTLNGGGILANVIGTNATTQNRVLMKLVPGAYWQTARLVDSVKMVLSAASSAVDTLLAAPLLMNWVQGTNDFTAGVGAPFIVGATWRSFAANALVSDSLWGSTTDSGVLHLTGGADSCLCAYGNSDLPTPMSQFLVGSLNYNGHQDRAGRWQCLGAYTGTVDVKTFDVSDIFKYIFNNPRASNYGFVLRDQFETMTGVNRFVFASCEAVDTATRPMFIVWSHDVLVPSGTGNESSGMGR